MYRYCYLILSFYNEILKTWLYYLRENFICEGQTIKQIMNLLLGVYYEVSFAFKTVKHVLHKMVNVFNNTCHIRKRRILVHLLSQLHTIPWHIVNIRAIYYIYICPPFQKGEVTDGSTLYSQMGRSESACMSCCRYLSRPGKQRLYEQFKTTRWSIQVKELQTLHPIRKTKLYVELFFTVRKDHVIFSHGRMI